MYLYLLRVILIKAANVKGISCINLTPGWSERRLQLRRKTQHRVYTHKCIIHYCIIM